VGDNAKSTLNPKYSIPSALVKPFSACVTQYNYELSLVDGVCSPVYICNCSHWQAEVGQKYQYEILGRNVVGKSFSGRLVDMYETSFLKICNALIGKENNVRRVAGCCVASRYPADENGCCHHGEIVCGMQNTVKKTDG